MRLLLALISLPLLAQTPAYNDFSPLVKGITIGQNKCYWWFKSPLVNNVHIACYLGTVTAENRVVSLGPGGLGTADGLMDFGGPIVKWIFTLGTFNLSVTLANGKVLITKSGVY